MKQAKGYEDIHDKIEKDVYNIPLIRQGQDRIAFL